MAKAKCSLCSSEVEKQMDEPPGCPICGFGKEISQQVIKFVPYPYYPYSPHDSYPYITCNDNTITISSSSTIECNQTN